MCKDGNYKKIRVKIPADLHSSGRKKWKDTSIDKCIAQIIEALQRGGIDMRGSCCGHNKTIGSIDLQDGRVLLILNKEAGKRYLKEVTKGSRLILKNLNNEEFELNK